MRIRVPLAVAARKIISVVLLGVVTFAMIVPVRDLAMGQGGTGSQPSAYTVKDLHPSGFADSYAFGISGGQQVGYGLLQPPPDRNNRALLWSGTAASVVDLTPTGPQYPSGSFDTQLVTSGVSGGLQVGYGQGRATFFRTHALLWNGTAASVMDLHDPHQVRRFFCFQHRPRASRGRWRLAFR